MCFRLFRQNFLFNSDGGGGAFQRLRGRYVTKSGNLQDLPKSEPKFTGTGNNNINNKRVEITVKAKCKRNRQCQSASIHANLCNALGTDPVKIWANWPTVFIISVPSTVTSTPFRTSRAALTQSFFGFSHSSNCLFGLFLHHSASVLPRPALRCPAY